MSDAIPLPKTGREIIPPTQTELRSRIDKAKEWADRVYREGPTYAMVGEYPSVPLNIVVHRPEGQGDDDYSPRFLGHYAHSQLEFGQTMTATRTAFAAPCYNEDRVKAYDEEFCYISFVARQVGALELGNLLERKMDFSGFKQPTLSMWREFHPDGHQRIILTLLQFCPSNDVSSVDLYIGDHLIAAGIDENTHITTQWSVETGVTNLGFGDSHGMGSGRYTIRHGCQMARHIYEAWGETNKHNKVEAFVESEGYTQDIYDPMFNKSTNKNAQFFQELDSWHDNQKGTSYSPGHHRIGHNPYGYAYESKVHSLDLMGYVTPWSESELPWLIYIILDPYMMALQALHVLNRSEGADHEYNRSKIPSWTTWPFDILKSTPRKTAEDIALRMISDQGIGVFGGKLTIDIPLPFGFHIPLIDNVMDLPGISTIAKKKWAGSGYRTAAFAALCATLGYGPTDDDRFKPWADLMIRNLCDAQWGVYTNHGAPSHVGVDHKGCNRDFAGGHELPMDLYYRPENTGGMLICWESTDNFEEMDNVWEGFVSYFQYAGAVIKRRGEAGTLYNSGHSSLPYFITGSCNAGAPAAVWASTINAFPLNAGVQHKLGAWVRGTYAPGVRIMLKQYNSSGQLVGTEYLYITQDYEDWAEVYTTFTAAATATHGRIDIEQSQGGGPLCGMFFDGVYVQRTSNGEYKFGGDADIRTHYRLTNSKGGSGVPLIEDWFQPDPLNQPIENQGLLVCNYEAVGAFIQALRIYNYHKYGDAYPSSVNLPTL